VNLSDPLGLADTETRQIITPWCPEPSGCVVDIFPWDPNQVGPAFTVTAPCGLFCTSSSPGNLLGFPSVPLSPGSSGSAGAPGSSGLPKAPVNKPKAAPKQDCHPFAKALAEGVSQFGSNTSSDGSGIIAAGLIAKNPGLVLVGEISALAGTGIQAIGAAGRLLATGNVGRAQYDAYGVAFSIFQSQARAASLALGVTGGTAVDLAKQVDPGEDCSR
jgi:hypothetical protein